MSKIDTKKFEKYLNDEDLKKFTKKLVILSGGVDSATVLTMQINSFNNMFNLIYSDWRNNAIQKNLKQELNDSNELEEFRLFLLNKFIYCVHFNYEQKPAIAEEYAVNLLCKHYKLKNLIVLKIPKLLNISDSLEEITQKESETVYPVRNLIFIGYATHLASNYQLSEVYIGVQKGDITSYPDTRPGFIMAVKDSVYLGSDKQIILQAPLLTSTKKEVHQIAKRLGVPFEKLSSCYHATVVEGKITHCGECPSCISNFIHK